MFCRQTDADYQRMFLTGVLRTVKWRFMTAVDWKKNMQSGSFAQQSVYVLLYIQSELVAYS